MRTEVPLVATLAYDRFRQMPQTFSVSLVPEPANRHDPKAIAVHTTDGVKIGYVAVDAARHYYDGLLARVTGGETVTCPARLTPQPGRVDARAILDLSRLDALREAG